MDIMDSPTIPYIFPESLPLLLILVWRSWQRSSRKQAAPDPLTLLPPGRRCSRREDIYGQQSIVDCQVPSRSEDCTRHQRGTCALAECSSVIPVASNWQKFGHSPDIILIDLLIRRNMGRGRILKRNLIGGDTEKPLRGHQWCVVGLRRAAAEDE